MNKVADLFILRGIQHWGQTTDDRIAAAQGVIDAAKFDARVTGYPFDQGSWAGEDATEAKLWLRRVMDTMPRGRFQDEAAHVAAAIETRQQNALA